MVVSTGCIGALEGYRPVGSDRKSEERIGERGEEVGGGARRRRREEGKWRGLSRKRGNAYEEGV